MPIINFAYKPTFQLRGGYLQTFIPALMKSSALAFKRQRLDLDDGDFVDLDWLKNGNKKLLILTHGLEGSSKSQYITDFCNQMDNAVYDILAWNCRSCSGELNRTGKLYHHGETKDLETVILEAAKFKYDEIHLVGFSMGGSINTKTLCVSSRAKEIISTNLAVSTPCELADAAGTLDKAKNALLKRYFFNSLKPKLLAKALIFPDLLDPQKLIKTKKWADFDRDFSAPMNGYSSLHEFYEQASINRFWDKLTTPTLLVNAQNDPMLPITCLPFKVAKQSAYLYLFAPKKGGHVYFPHAKAMNSAIPTFYKIWLNRYN